jgi:hypothetical protein
VQLEHLSDDEIYIVHLQQNVWKLPFASGKEIKLHWKSKFIVQMSSPSTRIPFGFHYVQCTEKTWIAVKSLSNSITQRWSPNYAPAITGPGKSLGFDYIPKPGYAPKKKKGSSAPAAAAAMAEKMVIPDEVPDEFNLVEVLVQTTLIPTTAFHD